MNQPQEEQHQPEHHQIIADGQVIYEGDDWQQAFLLAGMNPEFGTIVHVQDGEQGAVLGPVQPHTHPLS